jgi:arabinofuranosyltransferase
MSPKVKLVLLAIMAIFVVQSLSLNFTQDDAFISYRYVENLINGQGLVFNPGERVEGYTNFLWIIILSLFAGFGLDIIVVSKILGVASGCLTLFLLCKISTLFFQRSDFFRLRSPRSEPSRSKKGTVNKVEPSGQVAFHKKKNRSMSSPPGWFFALFPSLLLASNSAFAYWSISGLETGFFLMAILLSVYFYFANQRLMILFTALSTLIRPEGVLVFIIIILHKLFFKKDKLKDCLFSLAGFIALLLPFLLFKILYYKDILPNSFYAKTGFSLDYIKSGLEYFWLFSKHYALWGILYLLPILFYKSFDEKQKLFVLFTYVYTVYVIIIGGDVLMVHRFFLPVLPFLYLFYTFSIGKLFLMIRKRSLGILLSVLLIFLLSALTLLPYKWITQVRKSEKILVEKMTFWAESLNGFYGSNFTIAASTIGALSYYLDAKVIDMLGLTDKYISRHPEKVPGMVSSWKERRFNTQYLLSLDPDFILFSTERKPSAPAERALFLNSKFRENYYPVFFRKENLMLAVFKKKGDYLKENQIFTNVEFVNLYNDAFNLQLEGRYQEATEKLKRVFQIGPPNFAWAYELMGEEYYFLKDYPQSEKYLKKAIELDDRCVTAHFYLLRIYQEKNMDLEARQENKKILEYNPSFWGVRTH